MRSLKRIRNRFTSTARLGYAIAGAVLMMLPALVVYRDGGAGVTVALAISALFGIGYLIVAVLGDKIVRDTVGGTA